MHVHCTVAFKMCVCLHYFRSTKIALLDDLLHHRLDMKKPILVVFPFKKEGEGSLRNLRRLNSFIREVSWVMNLSPECFFFFFFFFPPCGCLLCLKREQLLLAY